MIASVTNQGKARWMIIDGAFNHERLIAFFEAPVKDAGYPGALRAPSFDIADPKATAGLAVKEPGTACRSTACAPRLRRALQPLNRLQA